MRMTTKYKVEKSAEWEKNEKNDLNNFVTVLSATEFFLLEGLISHYGSLSTGLKSPIKPCSSVFT